MKTQNLKGKIKLDIKNYYELQISIKRLALRYLRDSKCLLIEQQFYKFVLSFSNSIIILETSYMVTFKSLAHLIHQFDMFCSSELLRYRSQTQYKTLTGGIISLAIICVVVGGFASMVGDTLNRVAITSSLVTQKQSDPPLSTLQATKESMFMLGISIRSLDYSFIADLINGPQYFSLQLNFAELNSGMLVKRIRVQLEQCTPDHWSMMPELAANYQSFGLNYWQCLPLGTSLPLQGQFSSPTYSFAGIEVTACNNVTSNNRCAPQAQIDALMNLYQNFYLGWNYINPVINPNEQNFMSYFMEGGDFVIFSSTIGSEAWVFFSDYTIDTDSSIWPYEDVSTTTGCIVEQKAINHPYSVAQHGSFARIFLAKSSNSLTYERQVQKISAVLSYIGGLIGAITAVLFLVKSYTDTSLEVAIGLSLFELNQQQKNNNSKDQQKKEKTFNLFGFVQLTGYRLLKLCGWRGKMERPQRLQRCQEQAIKQMDVELLLKRIIKLEGCINRLFSKQQLKEIREGQPITFKTAKNMRMLLLKQNQQNQEEEKQSHGQNVVEAKENISNKPFYDGQCGQQRKSQSGSSIYRVKINNFGDASVPPQLLGDADPTSKIQQVKLFTRNFIQNNGHQESKAHMGKRQDRARFSSPQAIMSPIII